MILLEILAGLALLLAVPFLIELAAADWQQARRSDGHKLAKVLAITWGVPLLLALLSVLI